MVSSRGTPWGRQCSVCVAWWPGLKRFREEVEREGVEVFVIMDNLSLDLIGITANTVLALFFLRRALQSIGIVGTTAKTVALPPKAHALTTEISLHEGFDVCIVDG